MRVATWNINHVVKRLDLLLDWLARTQPDVVALQELKSPAADFPYEALAAAGYSALVVGQRAWNGVALLGRGHEPLQVLAALPGDAKDRQARYLEAAINGVLFACLYLPNGNPQPGPKFDYKLRWFERLKQRTAALWALGQPVVLLGDWNVVPTDADIYKPDSWRDNALLQPGARQAFAEVLAQGWVDALKTLHPQRAGFTFWDYRRQRWQRDAGLRIDHILVGAGLTVLDVGVDRDERGRDNCSDHAPVWALLGPAGQPAATAEPPLARYNRKRDFSRTAEPAGTLPPTGPAEGQPLQFVVQKHWASRLHYDFRLELEAVMLSWAVPKGPSYNPALKQTAIRVEDHPLDYNSFEGTIPKGQYGAGTVIVWDRGTWTPLGDPRQGLQRGKLLFRLHGDKLAGLWEVVRISKPGDPKQDHWLLLKKRGDAWARPTEAYDVIRALPDSVIALPLGPVEAREPHGVLPAPSQGAAPSPPDLRLARRAALPAKLAPQLATLVSAVPAGDWIVETKFDGYRLLARADGRQLRLFTRNGHDWTDKLQPIANALASLNLKGSWLDGEIVVMGEGGVPDFNRLQNAIDNVRTDDVVMFVFDAPFLQGQDLRRVPLSARRAALRGLLEGHGNDTIRFSESFEVRADEMLAAACRMGLEGVMLKRSDAPYTSGRSEAWLKLKCQLRQEFVVIGFTDRAGARAEVGGLLLAVHEGGQLRYAGAVGTGWNSATGRELHQRLSQLETDQPAVDLATLQPGRWSRRSAGSERWITPTPVVEVAFSEWTPEGHIRHGVFRGLRTDKPASQIVREQPAVAASAPARPAAKAGGLRVTNPTRVIDPSTGVRKVDLVHYYESIAPWMLPHLKDRPISLVRAPSGISGELFFQKHPETRMPGLKELDPALWPGHAALLTVDTAEALVAAAQMNTVEFHTWNSRARRIDQPDRFILDLDPGEGVTWAMLQEAAVLTRTMLTELGLKAWLKTSGGKGLHVVVPIAPRHGYDVVKALSQAIVQHMARVIPQRFVAKSGGTHRVGRIFIDYLRNGHAQTTAAAFSARARPGMGVSMPVAWEQLPELKSGAHWTIATTREYLSFQQHDPWHDYARCRQTITQALKTLGTPGKEPPARSPRKPAAVPAAGGGRGSTRRAR